MSIITVKSGSRLDIASGGLVNTGPIPPPPPPPGTDDFESYSIAAFPQSNWTTEQEDTNFSAEIVASNAAFPTQNVRTIGNAGIVGESFYSYDGTGNFVDGTASIEYSFTGGGVSTGGGVFMQYVDDDNYLLLRTFIGTAFLYEKISGTLNTRASNGGLAQLSQNFPYKLSLTTSGTNAHIIISKAFDDFADLWNLSGISITGGVSGKSGIHRYSVFYVNDVNFDNFAVTPA